MTARADILARIAQAHAAAPPAGPEYDAIPRGYRRPSGLAADGLVDLFVERLEDYRADARRCGADEVATTIARALRERGVASVAVPPGLPAAWLTSSDVDVHRDSGDHPLSVTDLDRVGGVITGCAVAIAETGTLVLDGSPDQGRRALTLVPDYFLCVLEESSIVADVGQALARLQATRPLTFVSGPSATSDIELNRVEGVHGPRTLEVVVVGG